MSEIRRQLRSMMEVEPSEAGFSATLKLDSRLSVLPDHFQGNPILPGMCLVQAVLIAGAMRQGVEHLRLATLKNAKFLSPVQPGEKVAIEAAVSTNGDDALHIKANLTVGERRVAQISLVAHPDVTSKGGAS